MGLLGMLAGLPLAPVKALAGLARHLEQQAEREREDELAEIQATLLELEFMQPDEKEERAGREADLLAKVAALGGSRANGESR